MIEHSDSLQAIGPALSQIAAEIENPKKTSENPHFRSRYADLAEIIHTSREVCARHGVSVVQSPGMDDVGRCVVETLLLHSSGEWIRGVARAPIQKEDPQGVGSAITYLRRYSLAAMLGLAQEDDDGSAASQPQQDRQQSPAANGKASPTRAASDKQMGFVRKLLGSSALTEDERAKIQRRVDAGMTSKQASDAIEWLQATIKEREEGAGHAEGDGELPLDDAPPERAAMDPGA